MRTDGGKDRGFTAHTTFIMIITIIKEKSMVIIEQSPLVLQEGMRYEKRD